MKNIRQSHLQNSLSLICFMQRYENNEQALPFNNNAFILFVVLEFVFALAYSHT